MDTSEFLQDYAYATGRPHRRASIPSLYDKQSEAASCTLYQQPCASSIHHASSPLFPDHPSRPVQSYNFSDANLFSLVRCIYIFTHATEKRGKPRKILRLLGRVAQKLRKPCRDISSLRHTPVFEWKAPTMVREVLQIILERLKTSQGGGRSMEYQGEASMHPCTCKARKLKADPEADDETS